MNNPHLALADIFKAERIPAERFLDMETQDKLLLKAEVEKYCRSLSWPETMAGTRAGIAGVLKIGVKEIFRRAIQAMPYPQFALHETISFESIHHPSLNILLDGQFSIVIPLAIRVQMSAQVMAMQYVDANENESANEAANETALMITLGVCEVQGTLMNHALQLLAVPLLQIPIREALLISPGAN
ncbi:hypothetical protein [Undibacterium pigrum]|uniref:Uncharacterized protein n=1 Tax=Undibacterium pigrum TaxID=401470 RepID=A0A318IWT8_9BURK|nr:hypothetical protein [Undibacterium pigrum]PXX34905.1 hypothetical protein DFR42_1258 [Undibacterium pigrum]